MPKPKLIPDEVSATSVVEPTIEPAAAPQPPASKLPANVTELLEKKRSWESEREAAIQELLHQRTEIENALTELGYEREPAFVVPAARPRKAKMPTAPGEKFCPICNLTGNHDGRAHKRQGAKKKPFTPAELAAL